MKQIYFLSLLLILVTPVFSQKKAEFGLVFSAGNFTRPFQQTTKEYYPTDQMVYTTINSHDAGNAFSIGVKQLLRLNKHLKLTGELLYRMASFENSFSGISSKIDGDQVSGSSVQSQKVRESSIAIPIKLHFFLNKKGSTSFALGAGFSQRLNAEFKGWHEYKYEEIPALNHNYRYPDMDLGFRDFSPELLLSAGLYHQLDNKTSLGIEYNYERRSDEALYYSEYFQYSEFLIDCLCYGFVYLKTPNLRSWSLTLSHNLSK